MSGNPDYSRLYSASQIAAETIETSHLAADAVETAKIKNLAVTAAKLAANAVETAKIKNLAVTAAKLAADAVETAKIKNLAVTAAKLAANAVETAKLKDGSVTAVKLAHQYQDALGPVVNPSSADAWVDWDISSQIDGDAQLVFIHMRNVAAAARTLGVRPDGSSLDRKFPINEFQKQMVMSVEPGPNGIIEIYGSDSAADCEFRVVGQR